MEALWVVAALSPPLFFLKQEGKKSIKKTECAQAVHSILLDPLCISVVKPKQAATRAVCCREAPTWLWCESRWWLCYPYRFRFLVQEMCAWAAELPLINTWTWLEGEMSECILAAHKERPGDPSVHWLLTHPLSTLHLKVWSPPLFPAVSRETVGNNG